LCLAANARARILLATNATANALGKPHCNGLTKTITEQLIGSSKQKGNIMAKKGGSADSVYKVVELVGTSLKSWEDAAKNAVETAAGTLRDLRVAEIVKLDMTVENGKVGAYRARVLVSFKYRS
jgi:dodecin